MITINVRNWLFHIGIFGVTLVGYWFAVEYPAFSVWSVVRLYTGMMCAAFIIVYRNVEVKK